MSHPPAKRIEPGRAAVGAIRFGDEDFQSNNVAFVALLPHLQYIFMAEESHFGALHGVHGAEETFFGALHGVQGVKNHF